MCLKSPDDISGGGDGYDTDMDDKMGLARSPSRHPLQDTGLDIQATQAGVSWLPCPLHADAGSLDAQLFIYAIHQHSSAQPVVLALLPLD
jgi:hypothetical protein